MWSPKRNVNGGSNRAYDAMRTVVPGDIIFSFADTRIKAIGIASSYCYEFPKPTEFGSVGEKWEHIGWRVDVNYQKLLDPIRPKDHINTLRSVLPPKYSPLQANGNGNQVFYLYDISQQLAFQLAQLMDQSMLELVRGNAIMDMTAIDHTTLNRMKWEDAIQYTIEQDDSINQTTKETLIQSRRGHGKYRSELLKMESACRVTGVNQKEHLIASHTKPWRDSNNEERLDPENGFMLTPSIDRLFDRGFISFDNNGDIWLAEAADLSSLKKMGVDLDAMSNVGSFSTRQKVFLNYHREEIFLG